MPSNIDDLIDHWEFLAELSYETPLEDLLHDGEVSPTRPDNAELRRGDWLPVYKGMDRRTLTSRRYLATPDPRHRLRYFSIEPLPVDGNPWKPWFIDVRRVIESDSTPDEKADAIASLRNSDRHAGIRRWIPRHIDFALAVDPLLRIGGVSAEVADELWCHELKTPEAVFAATDAELLSIRGLGAARLQRIREEQKRRHGARRPPVKRGSQLS